MTLKIIPIIIKDDEHYPDKSATKGSRTLVLNQNKYTKRELTTHSVIC